MQGWAAAFTRTIIPRLCRGHSEMPAAQGIDCTKQRCELVAHKRGNLAASTQGIDRAKGVAIGVIAAVAIHPSSLAAILEIATEVPRQ